MSDRTTILVAKTGGLVYFEDALGHQSPTGEQGATAGLVRWLARPEQLARYRTVYLGQWMGTLPEGIVGIQPNVYRFDAPDHQNGTPGISPNEQRERLMRLVDQVSPYEPLAFLNVVGYSPSWCMLWNPRGSKAMTTSLRYVSPQLTVAGELRLPRVVFNADLRCYPRESEMSCMYPSLRPVAVMSQFERTWERPRRVLDRTYRIREVPCGMENWHTEGRRLASEAPGGDLSAEDEDSRYAYGVSRDVDLCVMSHAHVSDGFGGFSERIGEGRAAAWDRLLRQPTDVRRELVERWTSVVYGEGWRPECVGSLYDADLMLGPVSPAHVVPELLRSRVGLVVTPWDRDPYVTSKVRYHAWAGCVPVMYGRTDGGGWVPHAGDGVGRYVPLHVGVPFRAYDATDLRACLEYWCDPSGRHEAERADYARALEVLTRPSFTRAAECVDRLAAGEAIDTEGWWADFGGYREGQ
jgi:hypothetical protein